MFKSTKNNLVSIENSGFYRRMPYQTSKNALAFFLEALIIDDCIEEC